LRQATVILTDLCFRFLSVPSSRCRSLFSVSVLRRI
jgi:hypothetical protein